MQDDIALYFAARDEALRVVIELAAASPDGFRLDPKTPKVDQLLAADVLRMRGFAPDRMGVWRSAVPTPAHVAVFDAWATAHWRQGFKTEEIMAAVFGGPKFRHWCTDRLRRGGLSSQPVDGVRLWRVRRLTHDENMAAAAEIGRRMGPELAARLAKSFENVQVHHFPIPARK